VDKNCEVLILTVDLKLQYMCCKLIFYSMKAGSDCK